MPTTTELIGYLASALVVASLAMTSVVRLRTISLIGSITFVVYAALIGSVPVILTNTAVALLNIYYLRKEFTARKDVGAVPIAIDAPYLRDFIDSHRDDIARTQPTFTDLEPDDTAWLLTRDGLPAGALIGRIDGEQMQVHLDYVLSAFRDSRIGGWLYGDGGSVLREAGVRTVVATASTANHRSYLGSVGFAADGERWTRNI